MSRALGWVPPVVLALGVGAVVLLATGDNPLTVYPLLAREAFGSPGRIAATLTEATPLLFTGLAAALAFRAGVFTLGVEGSFVAGGLAAAVVGAHVAAAPGPLAILAALAAALAAGLTVAAVPAVLRARWQVDEVVTTLMLNFVATGAALWLLTSFLQVPGVGNSATAFVAPNAQLGRLYPPSQVNIGLLLALALVAGYALWERRTAPGYEFRQVGANPRYATAAGIDTRRVLLLAILAAGAVGGLGGGAHTLGVVHRFVDGFSPGFGFAGVAIALLARYHPVGVVLSAVLFGALTSAGTTIQLFSSIPLDLVNVLQGAVMIFAAARLTLRRTRPVEEVAA